MKALIVDFPEFEKFQQLYQLDLARKWDDCRACPDLVESRTKIVHGSGNPKADLLMIGEGPGNEEDLEGVPFIGESGMLLNQLLILMGLTREDVFVDNLVPCRPLNMDEVRPSLRPPTKKEIETCSRRLHETILAVDPFIILAMGRPALHTLTRDTSLTITKVRGEVYVIRVPGIFKMVEYPIVVSQHPAYVLRNPSEAKYSPKWYLVRDFVFAVKLLNLAKRTYGR